MRNLFAIICLLLPCIIILVAFLGISIGITPESYDDWRLFEIIAILFTAIYTFIYYPKLSITFSFREFALLLIAVIIAFFSIGFSVNQNLALLDFFWMVSLATYYYNSVHIQKNFDKLLLEKYLTIIALAPLGVISWFFIGTYLYIVNSTPLVWHGLFTNIRYYGDALLPSIFLLWYRPSFLKASNLFPIGLSSLYLLTLYVDGSRAACLSIVISLIISGFLYRHKMKELFIPLMSIAMSIVFYVVYNYLIVENHSNDLIRSGSSNRLALWNGSLQYWSEHFLLGMGGANFIYFDRSINYQQVAHPHNIILQLLVEWGVIGTVICLLILLFYYQLFRQHVKIPVILFMGLIAFFINSLLSGAYIYPISQLSMLVFISFTSIQFMQFDRDVNEKIIKIHSSSLGIISIAVIFLLISSSVFLDKKNISNNIESWGPRFWSNAYAIYLPKEK